MPRRWVHILWHFHIKRDVYISVVIFVCMCKYISYISISSQFTIYSVCVIYYLKCKMYSKIILGKYVEKIIGDNTKGFKVRINQHISDFRTGVTTWKFMRQVHDCGIKNNCLEELFFNLNIMLRLNKSDRLEPIQKHYYLKGYDTVNNPVRN